MNVLEGLQPEKVFHYFEEISRIPHGSGNVEQISDYLLRFARERGLFCIQDEVKNIIIVKEAAPGYEQEEPFILQGHMDMVAVKEPGCEIDMTKEPLRLKAENGRICAEGTSLGGDDGIAVAYCLALLDSEELQHPRLEIILTVDEETGMEGAMAIDLSMLRGRRMINLDQEEEGTFTTSCAGGARVEIRIPVRRGEQLPEEEDFSLMEVKVDGLIGGHSGTEIHKRGANANLLLGQLVRDLAEQAGALLLSMEGGMADNAIPRTASAFLAVKKEQAARVKALTAAAEQQLRQQYGESDPALCVTCEPADASMKDSEAADGKTPLPNAGADAEMQQAESDRNGKQCGGLRGCTPDSLRNALDCLTALPNGVTAMSGHVPGLVETSLNLGVMKLTGEDLVLSYAVRSSVDEEKEKLCGQMHQTAARYGAAAETSNAYPGWAYRVDSPLREQMCRVYEQMYHTQPKLEAIHAGLECGILAGKIPELDCVSIGPDLSDVHTAQESMDIASVQRVWEYLTAVLACKSEN